jgi:hypothetical protein
MGGVDVLPVDEIECCKTFDELFIIRDEMMEMMESKRATSALLPLVFN